MIYIAIISGLIGAPLLFYSSITNKRNKKLFVISTVLVAIAVVLFFVSALT